jgi:septal ring factor EnvC (AmiA/AmiB activator)
LLHVPDMPDTKTGNSAKQAAHSRQNTTPGFPRHYLKGSEMTHTKDERAELVQEIERLEEQLTGLRAEKDRLSARRRGSNDYIPIPGLSPVLDGISTAECQLGILRDRLAQFDRVAAHLRDIKEASAKAETARQAADSAESRATELEARIALQGLEKARSKASAVKSKAGSDASIIAALTQEIEELERQATAAREEADAKHKAALGAQLIGRQAQWDEATEALLAIGRNIAQVADAGGHSTGLRDLRIPVFHPGRLRQRD